MMDIPVNDEDPGTDSSGVIRVPASHSWPGARPRMGRGPSVPASCLAWALPCSRTDTNLRNPCCCWACLAAMATLLNTQNPLAVALWLWCPGGLGVSVGQVRVTVPSQGPPQVGGVPRSPHQGEPVAHSSRQHRVHQLQRSPCGQPGTVEGTLRGRGPGQPPAPHSSQARPRPVPGYRAPFPGTCSGSQQGTVHGSAGREQARAPDV